MFVFILSPTVESKHFAHLLNEFIQDIGIHDSQQNQKTGADGSTYDATNGAETAEAIGHCCCCGCDDDGGYDDDSISC